MSYEAENRQIILDYFHSGEKGDVPTTTLGVEIEHFVVHKDTLAPVPYSAPAGELGVREILVHLSQFYPEKSYSTQGDLIGLGSEVGTITLEPAAQLEISIAPYGTIARIEQVYTEFRARLDPFLDEWGCELRNGGYHPSAKALDLQLIPKQRYRYMNEYFASIGTHGERMMRASASTQVSVDYRSEADAIRKMRIAQALAVVLATLTDNTYVMEGEPTKAPLERLNLWRDVDDARTGSVPGLFEPEYGFERYADWVLGTCPIFVTRPAADDPDGPGTRSAVGLTAAQAYADAPMSKSDVEHLLSMFWPDVRLKRFVEIRPADSLPIDMACGYAALIRGLFYSDDSMSAIEEAFGVRDGVWPLDDGSANRALAEVRARGGKAVVSGRTLKEWQDIALDVASSALDEGDRKYLDALYTRIDALRNRPR